MSLTTTYRVVSNPVSYTASELTVLFAGESQTKPLHRIGPKVVDYYLLHHVVSGKGSFRTGEFQAELAAGDSFLIHPGQLFHYVSDEEHPWRYRWVAFAGAQAASLIAEAGLGLENPIVHSGGSKIPGERCRSIFEAFRERGSSASLLASGHLHLLFASLHEATAQGTASPLRPDSHSEDLVRKVIGYLSTQYAEPVTIEGMAETLGYNRAYLSRLFKQHTGISPVGFLTKIRVDHGRRLLRERPELTVEQIASSVGFQDALYFSKQFRRLHGQSPTDYRVSVGESLKPSH
ncbi:AraC family transcriptional regulator [Cohnella cholangitidis]|uniref:AraC family transcriptional regulator n=1 Tax=Cohnella cholangitidis TaxID=2598458 RepID=A0A7G5BVT0_9BACL|nr:AraC family transcriptional regulator [Cohnella cholangitidis]QMV41064.1 AraC family transcriptional regulator [Cohnella cholangitidis]